MDRSARINTRHAFLGTAPPGALPAVTPNDPLPGPGPVDRSSVAPQRPLERLLAPGAPRLKSTPITQAPSLQDAASPGDWLEWATTFG